MHRIHGASFRTTILPVLVAVWVLAGHGWTAAAAEETRGTGTGLLAAGADPVGIVPYASLGMALIRSEDTRFVDGADSGHAALYGNEDLFDAGSFDDGLQFHMAAGVRLPYRLRAQLEFGAARALDWRGNANYRDSGARQPSEARLDTRQILFAGFRDFPGWELAPGRSVRPFLGAGLGLTRYSLSGYVQGFPEPDDPRGSLRRGPGGEIPFTALPGGSGRNFTWMLTAGIAVPITGGIDLDLSYRYTDAGKIRTDTGDIAIVRFREDGTRREIQVPVNGTFADCRTHALLVSFRFGF